MSLSKDADYPDCVNCETNVFVRGLGGGDGDDWKCEFCEVTFS